MQEKNTHDLAPVVGVWKVEASAAPFPWHMMTFTPYGTMLQTNPPEGNQDESDSGGQGVWKGERTPDGSYRVRAVFVEYKADRQTGAYIGRGEITLDFTVRGDAFSGTSALYRYDAAGAWDGKTHPSPVAGTRLVLDGIDHTPLA